MSLFQSPVGANLWFDGTSSWKNRLSPKLSQPGFSIKSVEPPAVKLIMEETREWQKF
jgi:hypothetical protein